MDTARTAAGTVASALNAALRDEGWRKVDLIAACQQARRRLRLKPIDEDNVRRQLNEFFRGSKTPGAEWQAILTEAFHLPAEALFGLATTTALPSPLLVSSAVTDDVVDQMFLQRAVHARSDHLLGPESAHELVDTDLRTIEALIAVTPTRLRARTREAAALIAELGGWIAQDSGDPARAEQLTIRALDHARRASPEIRAMLYMRRSNIIMRYDPHLAVEFADDAADLIDGREHTRLHATIARQQALAAARADDRAAFHYHRDRALDLAATDPAPEDLATYASPAYVRAETAAAQLLLGEHQAVVEALADDIHNWPDGQQRDHSVARLRLMRAYVHLGDIHAATELSRPAIDAYRATPSQRGRLDLRDIRLTLGDRARSTMPLPAAELRHRVIAALEGEPQHARPQ